MELEKLTKAQIVLLTLLVSFVTSIATGIVTVTLLDQAPPGITHTVSKVVETTVEKVVPTKSQGATTVKTVVVKEDDLIADAAEKNEKSAVRILVEQSSPTGGDEEGVDSVYAFVSFGFVLSQSGLIATDSAAVSDGVVYTVELANGTRVDAQAVAQDEERGLAFLQADLGEGRKLIGATLADSDQVRLGQTALTVLNVESGNTRLLSGIVSSFTRGTKTITKEEKTEEGETIEVEKELSYRSGIVTDIDFSKNPSGSALLDTDGHVIGVNLARAGGVSALPANLIREAVRAYEERVAAEEESGRATSTPEEAGE